MGGYSGLGRSLAGVAAAIMIVFATGAQAEAGQSMLTGGLTSQPIGHYDFCKRKPAECSIRPRDNGPVELTDELWEMITSVNIAVNEAVAPLSDYEIYGQVEYWAYPDDGVGDCEDYALEKRRTLMNKGVSLSNLLITVVRKADGEGHAILTVRTSQGDFILDNLTDEVRLWSEPNYRYLKRQAVDHTGRWVSLKNDNSLLVSSVR